jgi:Rrf2 family nitric oxide-sensitive transcriptional repressor
MHVKPAGARIVQLTTFTDYTLRVLISVGAKDAQEMSTIPEISRQYGISRNHLVKIVHHLSQKGYLTTSRGKGGGLRLAKPAAAIRIGDVIRDAENHFNLAPCFNAAQKGDCAIEPACALKRLLREAVQAFLAVTDEYTLADLLRPRRRLQLLLEASA